jgi:hypothetical protein
MAENLVAIFTVGMLTKLTQNFVGAKKDIIGMRTLIFTNTRLLVAELVADSSIDSSIKRHTKEYEDAVIGSAKEKIEALTRSGDIDAVLQSPNAFSVDYDRIEKIKTGGLLLPQLNICQYGNTILQFIAMDKVGFKGSLHALREFVPKMME